MNKDNLGGKKFSSQDRRKYFFRIYELNTDTKFPIVKELGGLFLLDGKKNLMTN